MTDQDKLNVFRANVDNLVQSCMSDGDTYQMRNSMASDAINGNGRVLRTCARKWLEIVNEQARLQDNKFGCSFTVKEILTAAIELSEEMTQHVKEMDS